MIELIPATRNKEINEIVMNNTSSNKVKLPKSGRNIP